MKKMSEPIVFFGSGPVAAESLRLLYQHCTIEAVITKPRAAHHKGDVPVLRLAKELHIPTFTATNKATLDDLFTTDPVSSRLAVLIDFGIIVSQKVINYFPLGIVNSHFSLLPEWRGADPITFSILSGQKRTGVSLMLLTAGMDEGPLLAQTDYELSAESTTPSLTADLITLSDEQLKIILPLYVANETMAVDQSVASISDVKEPTYSRKLTKQDGQINWSDPAAVIERTIRAYLEWPKSRATISGLEVIITRAHVVDETGNPGQTAVVDKYPVVFCGKQALALDTVKPAGKKEMTGEAFLAGYKNVFLGQ
jgi:methionyl-tRNA formyltransferase